MENIKKEEITNDITTELKKKVYITNQLNISKKYSVINKAMINRYSFLSPFINEEALFFEDIYYSIFYILVFEDNECDKCDEYDYKYNEFNENHKKSKCVIYNYMIDKLNKRYCKNSLSYYEFKDALLNLYFVNLKKSFIYSNLHLSGYEYDLNHDINEWLNMVKYEDVTYTYLYISRVKNIEYDYTF